MMERKKISRVPFKHGLNTSHAIIPLDESFILTNSSPNHLIAALIP